MQRAGLQLPIRKPRAKPKAAPKPRPNPRQPIPRPESDYPETRLVENVVLTYRKGEADQPNLANPINRTAGAKYPVMHANNFNWLLKYSEEPLRFAHLQGDLEKFASLERQTYNNARCDACGQKCNLLYVVRCYKKRNLNPEERGMEATRARMHYDLRLRDSGAPRALRDEIMYFGRDCLKNVFRSRVAGNGDVAEESESGNGHEDIATARNAANKEVDAIIGWAKASNCPSARAQDETAARRNAERACSAAIDKAARAAEDSKAQVTEAARCRVEGERIFLQMNSLLPPGYDRRRDVDPALVDMLEDMAREVKDFFDRAKLAWTAALRAKGAVKEAKADFLVDSEISGNPQLKVDAAAVMSTATLDDNVSAAEEAHDFLQDKSDRSHRIASLARLNRRA